MKVISFTKIYRCIAVAAFILLVLTGLFLMLSWMMLVPGNRVKSVSTYSGLYAETDVFVELVCGYEDIENGDVLVYEADVHGEKVLLAGRVQETTGRKIVLQDGILSDGELKETQTANYFSNLYPIDCAVLSVNAQSCRKYGTLPEHEFLPGI